MPPASRAHLVDLPESKRSEHPTEIVLPAHSAVGRHLVRRLAPLLQLPARPTLPSPAHLPQTATEPAGLMSRAHREDRRRASQHDHTDSDLGDLQSMPVLRRRTVHSRAAALVDRHSAEKREQPENHPATIVVLVQNCFRRLSHRLAVVQTM